MARLVMSPTEKARMFEGLNTAREIVNTARTDIPDMEGKIPVAIRKRMDAYFAKIDEIMEAAIMYSENYMPLRSSSTSKSAIHKRLRSASPEQLAAIDAILGKEEEEEANDEENTEE